jgi:pyruvate carboxylase
VTNSWIVLNPKKKYNLEYYVSVVDKIVGMGAHILGIKDSKLNPYAIVYVPTDSFQWLVS